MIAASEMQPPREGDAEVREITLLDVVNMLLRHPRIVFGLPVVFMALAVALTLASKSYSAKSRFMPQGASAGSMAHLAGLAAQFGVAVPGGKDGESPDFYAELLRSPSLLEKAALTNYRFPVDSEKADTLEGTLLEIYEIKGETEGERMQNVVDRLRDDVTSGSDIKANLVHVTTVAPYPALAEQLNHRLLDLVSEFNAETRRSRATQEREFIEERLSEVKKELAEAENELSSYLDTNRAFRESSARVVQMERLQRRVSLLQQVYTSLAQSYEQSRIEEVRDVPVVTIVDSPEGSARPRGKLVLNALLGLVVGLMLALGSSLVLEFTARLRVTDPQAYQEFTALLRRLSGRRARA